MVSERVQKNKTTVKAAGTLTVSVMASSMMVSMMAPWKSTVSGKAQTKAYPKEAESLFMVPVKAKTKESRRLRVHRRCLRRCR
jgi:hypothetical protein